MRDRATSRRREPDGVCPAAGGSTEPARAPATLSPIGLTGIRPGRGTRSLFALTSAVLAVLAPLLTASGCHHVPPVAASAAELTEATQAPAQPTAEEPPPATTRALHIELGDQSFAYFEDGRLVRSGEVSSGAPEHPTPTGKFRVLSKQKDKVSRSYTNYYDRPTPMPYSLQFLGPYYIHEGWMPGHPDSHGCVRLHYEDARFLFARMKVGDEVAVTNAELAANWRAGGDGGPKPSRFRRDWLSLDDPRRLW